MSPLTHLDWSEAPQANHHETTGDEARMDGGPATNMGVPMSSTEPTTLAPGPQGYRTPQGNSDSSGELQPDRNPNSYGYPSHGHSQAYGRSQGYANVQSYRGREQLEEPLQNGDRRPYGHRQSDMTPPSHAALQFHGEPQFEEEFQTHEAPLFYEPSQFYELPQPHVDPQFYGYPQPSGVSQQGQDNAQGFQQQLESSRNQTTLSGRPNAGATTGLGSVDAHPVVQPVTAPHNAVTADPANDEWSGYYNRPSSMEKWQAQGDRSYAPTYFPEDRVTEISLTNSATAEAPLWSAPPVVASKPQSAASAQNQAANSGKYSHAPNTVAVKPGGRPQKTPKLKFQGPDQQKTRGEGKSFEHRRNKEEKWQPAVKYADIRDALLEGAKRRWTYDIPPVRGITDGDETAPAPEHRKWGPERKDRPIELFMLEEPLGLQPACVPVPWMYNKRRVIDREGQWMTFWTDIPVTISSQIEGYRMEAMRRRNPQVTIKDFRARMLERFLVTGKNGKLVEHVPFSSTVLTNRMMRWRWDTFNVSWGKDRGGSAKIGEYLKSKLPQECIDANSTRSHRDLNDAEKKELREIRKQARHGTAADDESPNSGPDDHRPHQPQHQADLYGDGSRIDQRSGVEGSAVYPQAESSSRGLSGHGNDMALPRKRQYHDTDGISDKDTVHIPQGKRQRIYGGFNDISDNKPNMPSENHPLYQSTEQAFSGSRELLGTGSNGHCVDFGNGNTNHYSDQDSQTSSRVVWDPYPPVVQSEFRQTYSPQEQFQPSMEPEEAFDDGNVAGCVRIDLQIGKHYIVVFVDKGIALQATVAPNNNYAWAKLSPAALMQEARKLVSQSGALKRLKGKGTEERAMSRTEPENETLYLKAGDTYIIICVDDKTAHKRLDVEEDETAWVEQDLQSLIQDIQTLDTPDDRSCTSSAAGAEQMPPPRNSGTNFEREADTMSQDSVSASRQSRNKSSIFEIMAAVDRQLGELDQKYPDAYKSWATKCPAISLPLHEDQWNIPLQKIDRVAVIRALTECVRDFGGLGRSMEDGPYVEDDGELIDDGQEEPS